MGGHKNAKILYIAVYIYTLVEHVPRHTGHAGTCLAKGGHAPWGRRVTGSGDGTSNERVRNVLETV